MDILISCYILSRISLFRTNFNNQQVARTIIHVKKGKEYLVSGELSLHTHASKELC